MREIVGIRFKEGGKVYYFDPNGITLKVGELAVVETARGIECGEVSIANRTIEESEIVAKLKPVLRAANQNDLRTLERNKKREAEAFRVCEEKIAERKLKMSLVSVECAFENNKLLFYFTADNRVDFRELVKDLAAAFRTRIELRQIGVRDEARMLGGIGICGREFCCKSYMSDFNPVSIKMAKEQGLSLNPTKISGTCGRLMCCLKNEQSTYEQLLKITPKVGAVVELADGTRGRVEEANILTGRLKVKTDAPMPTVADRKDVKLLKDGAVRVSKEEMKALKKLEDK